jgi:hypothetical protein
MDRDQRMTQLSERARRFLGEDGYRRHLREPARALWLDLLSPSQFAAAFISAIERGLNSAWAEGASECGVGPDDLTPEEIRRRNEEIAGQFKYIPGVMQFIAENRKADGGAWAAVASRIELWVNRYRAVRSIAAAMACKDKKKKFIRVRPTLKPCRSCKGLEGRVYRYSTWLENEAVPPSPRFECGGWQCAHDLQDTDEPVTKGPFPRGLLKHD